MFALQVKYGGYGYSHILKNVIPKMRIRGITQAQTDQILIHTPRRWRICGSNLFEPQCRKHVDDLVQDCSISIANALEIL